MNPFRPDIPPHVAEVIRSLHPNLKGSIKAAVRGIATDPECGGGPLMRELDGLWKYCVRRFRIVYAIDRRRGSFASLPLVIANLSMKI